ncbi:hypothetical protein [Goodfellowiella coeruleoviolacea]|uniref:hypothetical protein n=1 Tax=Goodfellowiella coeruleoviolacea TaxID=334858 RepID=UPI0020A2D7F9|nr:hypothetical protein [Goodfellowiella coeruleoviolacea]
MVDVTALLVFLALGLVAFAVLGGLWLHLITTFPLDDRPTNRQPRHVSARPHDAPTEPTAPGSGRVLAMAGLPLGHVPTNQVHCGQEAAA